MAEPGIKEVFRGKFISFDTQGDVWLNQVLRKYSDASSSDSIPRVMYG